MFLDLILSVLYIYIFRNIGGTFRECRGVSECEIVESARECEDRGERETRAGKSRERRGPFYCMFSELLWNDYQMKLMTQNCDSNCLVIKSYPQKSTWHEQTYARRCTHTQNMPHFFVITIAPDKSLFIIVLKKAHPLPTIVLPHYTISNRHASALHSCPARVSDILSQPLFYWHGVRHRVIGLSSSFSKIHFFALWLLLDAFCSPFVF